MLEGTRYHSLGLWTSFRLDVHGPSVIHQGESLLDELFCLAGKQNPREIILIINDLEESCRYFYDGWNFDKRLFRRIEKFADEAAAENRSEQNCRKKTPKKKRVYL